MTIALLTRFTTESFNLTDRETLDIDVVNDLESPHYRRIPIPSVLDAQLDQIWMGQMTKLKRKVVTNLNGMATGNDRRQNWYFILLTVLVLRYNIAVVRHNQEREKKRCDKNVSTFRKRLFLGD